MQWWALIRDIVDRWFRHKDARLGAALAYYSIFALGPLIVIVIAVAGSIFGPDAVRGEVSNELRGLLGDAGSSAINAMLANASRTQEGVFASTFATVMLLFAATGMVVQLKDALNVVWEVDETRHAGLGNMFRAYFLSIAMILTLGFLLLVSMTATAGLAAGGKFLTGGNSAAALQVLASAISITLIAVLFALIFKVLPDTDVRWHDVWRGAALTAVAFEAGKIGIGFYIGKLGLDSSFGAAASIIVVLVWVYFCAQILLLGAEFTCAFAHQFGSRRK